MQRSYSAIAVMILHAACGARMSLAAEVRTWKDMSGKFQVRAELIQQTETTVRLKKDDGREISVPIQRLSQSDQDYLKSLNTPSDNPFAGGTLPSSDQRPPANPAATLAGTLRALPPSTSIGDEIALPGTGTTIDLGASPAEKPFTPDPMPEIVDFPLEVVQVSAVDAYDKVSIPVVANRTTGEFLVSIGRNKAGSPQETRGRIYWVNLPKKTSNLVWEFPNAVAVLGHDPASGRTLIVEKLDIFQRGGELVMVEGLASGNPKTLYRRTLPGAGKPGFAPMVEWASLLSGSHVAAVVDGVLHLWDLPAAKLLYRIEKVKSAEPPVFSGNQIYMAVPQSEKVVIVETSTGAIRASFGTGTTLNPGVAFHPDGKQLAVAFSNQFQVWDCVANNLLSEATTTDHLGSHPVHWIGPKMFRAALGDAVDVELGMSVWKYNLSVSTEPLVFAKRLITATTTQNCALVSAEIPNAAAQKSAKQLASAGDDAMLVRPGSTVAIAVESSAGQVDEAAIKASLTSAAEKAGWKVGRNAPTILVAKIGRGATEQLHFRSLGGGPRTESTATLTPFTAELEIRRGSTVLWTRKTINHIPSLLQLKEGETVQDAVKRYEKPDAGFFSLLTLPPRILKPEVTRQLGRSVLNAGNWQEIGGKPAPAAASRRR